MGSLVFGSYETAAATHVGRVRQRNEDAYLLRPEVGLWAVADGMGGHHSGDLASQTIIDSLKSIEPQGTAADLLAACETHVASANQRLKEIGKARGGVIVGATLAALLVFEDFYACLWSGDSRIYMVRDGTITAQEAETWPRSNIVTRAIGVFEEPELEITSGPLLNGDTFLVCSDGLTRHVADTEILSCVSSEPAQQVCDNLISLALERGGLDNVTVVVMHYCPRTTLSRATGRSDQSIERG